MSGEKDFFIHCDELAHIPALNRTNYEIELAFLAISLPQSARVLQVGSMDGMRAIRLLSERPDIQFTGLDIEAELVAAAQKNVASASLDVACTPAFIVGDITNPPTIQHAEYVLCLNHTLGYIPDQDKAIQEMRKLGTNVVISVYGEAFDDGAEEYFGCLGLSLDRIENGYFMLHDTQNPQDTTQVRRYSEEDVMQWGGKITRTPAGYVCEIQGT